LENFKKEKGVQLLRAIEQVCSKDIKLMEVCGTHTVSIFRHGLRSVIPENIHMLSGPGCPVCVTDQGDIDAALEVASRENIIIATYGDMLRVPGSETSLATMKARGSDIRIITSAHQCIDIAGKNPDREIVFFAVGFETTAPATAALMIDAHERKISNLSAMALHKRTPPVLEALATDPDLEIDGFILPGHVSVILGHEPYSFLAERYKLPSCITGFEAEDILMGIYSLTRQIQRGKPKLSSVYPRAVRKEGNIKAKKLMETAFEVCDAKWRGLGIIPNSGLKLKELFSDLDSYRKFDIRTPDVKPPAGCRCGEVLSGKLIPPECPLFAKKCTPASPVGPCMVSSEGSCSAYFKYSGGGTGHWKI